MDFNAARGDLDAVPKGVLGARFTAVGIKPSQVASLTDRFDRW
jgi:hypothetical protein